MSSYDSHPFAGFGDGLNLTDKPDAVSPAECIDALNVEFSDRGAIQPRPGYDCLTSSPLTNRVESLEAFYTTGGTKQLLAGCGTRLEAVSSAGAVVDSETGLTSAVWDFARFGQPNSEVAYAGNGTDTLRKWNGTEWTAPTATVDGEATKAMPKAGSLCVQPTDNRLVATRFSTTTGGPNGVVSSPSHIFFSEAGNPEGWSSTDSEQLTPGDGEAIQAAIAWREFVFVFKETRFFVFYGNATDADGGAIFNYRPVEAGVGLVSPRAICAHPSGVYFLGRNGVYRTTGQEPELISSAIEPIWAGGASAFYTGGTLAQGGLTNCAMAAYNERIYLSFPTESANDRILVHDPQSDWWSLYDIPASCLTTFRAGAREELVFGYAAGTNDIGCHSLAFTNDDGTAITERWRSGWFDLDSPFVKKIRRSKVWGSGKALMGLSSDFEQDVGKPVLIEFTDPETTTWDGGDWGSGEWTAPDALNVGYRNISERGTTFSVYFANETKDQPWSIHRIEHLTPAEREPSKSKARR